jgi:hypothetical protein
MRRSGLGARGRGPGRETVAVQSSFSPLPEGSTPIYATSRNPAPQPRALAADPWPPAPDFHG